MNVATRQPAERASRARRAEVRRIGGRRSRSLPTVLTVRRAEEILEGHGPAAYALACALLGDATRATRAVALGVVDLACSAETPPADTRRVLARQVYRRSQEMPGYAADAASLPATMLWLAQLARLQRTVLALCVFGGHTHREAAELLGVSPQTVALSLTSGLKDLGHLALAETVLRD
jgi:Sigma-70, region 4